MNVYATFRELKEYMGINNQDSDDFLKRFAIQASRMFDTHVTNGVDPERRFYPTTAAKDYDHPTGHPTTIWLYDDLLEIDTLTSENGAVSIGSGDYFLIGTDGRYNQTPYKRIQITDDTSATVSEFTFNTTQFAANKVTGSWGYHKDWVNAWEDSGDSVQDAGGINATVTTITVTDADGDDINGLENRFKTQQLIRLGSEMLWITGRNTADNELTVRRGMNGSTAAVHANDVQIDVYRPQSEIVEAMMVFGTYLFRHKNVVGKGEDLGIVTSDGAMIMPKNLPNEVQGMLNAYRKQSL